jgi:adenylate kinase family enzyme
VKYIHITGGPGSGTSTLARKLADRLGLGYIELDALYWQENWGGTEYDEFATKIQNVMDKHPDGWVIDGSYKKVATNFIQPKIDTLVYLQIPPYKTVPRILKRGFNRVRNKTPL